MLNARVGTAPVNWNNRDIRGYRAETPYERMLDEMASAGYEGTEYGEEFPHDPERVRADLAARNLSLASAFCAVNLRVPEAQPGEIERAEQVASLLASLGSDMLIVADAGDEHRRQVAGRVGSADIMGDPGWEHITKGLTQLAERLRALGVDVVFHNHVGTYVEREAELCSLLDGTAPYLVGLCLDVGHLLYAGGSVDRIMDRYGDRIRYVHLKDTDTNVLERCRRERLGFHDALRLGIFTEFGAGGLDFKGFFDRLDLLDYSGWIIVEQDTTRKTPLESARINRQYLRKHFGT